MLAFFSRLPRCLVGIEACATAHYWARELSALGHEVEAYIKRNKNDAADAEAICEAVSRPTMRFVSAGRDRVEAARYALSIRPLPRLAFKNPEAPAVKR